MKKLILTLSIFFAITLDAFGLGYNLSSTRSAPTFTYSGNTISFGAPFTQYTDPNYAIKSFITSDHIHAVTSQVVELDFSDFTGTTIKPQIILGGYIGEYPLALGESFLYMSGTRLGYRVVKNTLTESYAADFNIAEFGDIQNLNTGNPKPKSIVFLINELFRSENFIFNDYSSVIGIQVCKITATTNCKSIDFRTLSGMTSHGYEFADAFYNFNFPMRGLGGSTIVQNNLYNSHNSSWITPHLEVITAPFKDPGSEIVRQDIPTYRYVLQDITSYFEDPVTALPTSVILQGVSRFYTNTGVTNFDLIDSSGTGSSTGSNIDYFADCTSFLDVGCYVKGVYNSFKDWISGFFPDVSFSGTFDSCGSGASTNSGNYMQRLANVIAIVNPIPPSEGEYVCTLMTGGGSGQILYSRIFPEEGFFKHYIPGVAPMLEINPRVFGQTPIDLIIIVVFTILIFYKPHKND